MYSARSQAERGTMYQLRTLINRTNVPSDPQNNMNAAEDFMALLLHAHVVAAAETIADFNPMESVTDVARAIVANFIRFPDTTPVVDDSGEGNTGKRAGSKKGKKGAGKQRADKAADGKEGDDGDGNDDESTVDGIHLYATELLTVAMVWHGFHDASKEGDGERILRYWKLLLVFFKSTNRRNYAKEAVNLLFQYHCKFSDRQKHQLLWGRCVNVSGVEGANIPCDLHMEHLNRRLKTMIRHMGANVKPKSIIRAGKAIHVVHRLCKKFEEQTVSRGHSDRHKVPSFGQDFHTILDQLTTDNVFLTQSTQRKHPSFKYKCGIFDTLSRQQLISKVNTNIKQLL